MNFCSLFKHCPLTSSNAERSLLSFLATIVTFAPILAASNAMHLPIPLEPPVTWKKKWKYNEPVENIKLIYVTRTWRPSRDFFFGINLYFKTATKTNDKANTPEVINANIMCSMSDGMQMMNT